jgi:hypothetical protein
VSDLLYHLNARDEISSVNEEWQSFARANEGEHLLAGPILGRVLWDFIEDLGPPRSTASFIGAYAPTACPCGSGSAATRRSLRENV